MHEFSTTVLAEVSNVALHFLHPLTSHQHHCSCLLCATQEQTSVHTSHPNSLQNLVPPPTPSDLDLVKTGSKAIRQLVVLGETKNMTQKELRFCAQLKTYLNYEVDYDLPYVDITRPFQVLVLIILRRSSTSEDVVSTWFQDVLNRCTRRAVLICTNHAKITFKSDSKLTSLCSNNVSELLDMLTHGMMITHQRLMPKDINKFFGRNGTITMEAPQPFTCLFL